MSREFVLDYVHVHQRINILIDTHA